MHASRGKGVLLVFCRMVLVSTLRSHCTGPGDWYTRHAAARFDPANFTSVPTPRPCANEAFCLLCGRPPDRRQLHVPHTQHLQKHLLYENAAADSAPRFPHTCISSCPSFVACVCRAIAACQRFFESHRCVVSVFSGGNIAQRWPCVK